MRERKKTSCYIPNIRCGLVDHVDASGFSISRPNAQIRPDDILSCWMVFVFVFVCCSRRGRVIYIYCVTVLHTADVKSLIKAD